MQNCKRSSITDFDAWEKKYTSIDQVGLGSKKKKKGGRLEQFWLHALPIETN